MSDLQAYLDTARVALDRADKATAGPWCGDPAEFGTYDAEPGSFLHGAMRAQVVAATAPGAGNRIYACPDGGTFPAADQRFIAAARQDVPALAAAVEALAAELARVTAERDTARAIIHNGTWGSDDA